MKPNYIYLKIKYINILKEEKLSKKFLNLQESVDVLCINSIEDQYKINTMLKF